MDETPTILPTRIPLFPLPNIVLFPAAIVPLHIFEERYRLMVKRCLDGDGCFGIVRLRDGWESQAHDPPLHEVGALGQIVAHHALPDGRSNILVKGLKRFRLAGLHRELPYLVADIAYADPPMLSSAADAALRATLAAAFQRYLACCSGDTRKAKARLAEQEDADTAADFVAAVLDVPVDRRQDLLEALDPATRIAAISAEIERLVAAAGIPRPGRGTLPGFSLN